MISRRRFTFACGSLVLASRAFAAPDPPALLFTNALVWDGNKFVEGASVLTRGGRIATLTQRRLPPPPRARVIDCRGATLLPGLIDSHTHFFDLGASVPAGSLQQVAARDLPLTGLATLASGVTTARDHFFDLEYGPAFARLAQSELVAAPRIQLSGPALAGDAPPDRKTWRGVANAEDAIAKIRQSRIAGCTWLALENIDKFSPGVWDAIVREARASGIRLMVGTETEAQLKLAIAAGADTLDGGLGEAAYDLSDMSRYARVTFAGELSYYRNRVRMRAMPSLLDDPRPLRFMPPELADAARQSLHRELTEQPPTIREAQYDTVAANFAALHRAGARMVVASDSGSAGQFQTDAIWTEMAAWHAAGISVADTLRSATSIPAALFRQENIGRIAPGTRADLVLYRGDIRDGTFDPALVDAVAKGGNVLVENGTLTAQAIRPDVHAPNSAYR